MSAGVKLCRCVTLDVSSCFYRHIVIFPEPVGHLPPRNTCSGWVAGRREKSSSETGNGVPVLRDWLVVVRGLHLGKARHPGSDSQNANKKIPKGEETKAKRLKLETFTSFFVAFLDFPSTAHLAELGLI